MPYLVRTKLDSRGYQIKYTLRNAFNLLLLYFDFLDINKYMLCYYDTFYLFMFHINLLYYEGFFLIFGMISISH